MAASPRLGLPEAGPTVSVVIPAYNNARTILPLLDSVLAQTATPDEVLIVDDASTDQTPRLAATHALAPRIVTMERNSGPSAARNRGVREARGEVVLFLDSDVVVDNAAVARIKAAFSDPNVAAVNGRMEAEPLNPGWAPLYKCLVEYAWGDALPQWDASSTCLNTRIGAIRRSLFLDMDGFDASYAKPLVEDHEFGQRLAKREPILFDRRLKAKHHFSGFRLTVKNYWKRTRELLAMLWATPDARTDKGGASTDSAREFVLGAIFLFWLGLAPWSGPWPALCFLLAFAAVSYRSLQHCLRRKGLLFYLYCLGLHSVYGAVVVAAGASALVQRKLTR